MLPADVFGLPEVKCLEEDKQTLSDDRFYGYKWPYIKSCATNVDGV